MAKSCEYCEGCRDSLIRDRLIVGLKDTETVNVLLKKPGTKEELDNFGSSQDLYYQFQN